MSNHPSINSTLQEISLQEGEYFTYNEEKIIKDMEEQRNAFSNWGISILSVLGGLLATIFLIGFLLLGGLYDSGIGMLVFGFILITGSVLLNKVVKSLLLDTSTIACYIAGYTLMVAGFMDIHAGDNFVILLCLFIALAVIYISDSAMLVFISVLILNGSLIAFILENDLHNATHLYVAFTTAIYVYLSLHETNIISKGEAINIRYNPIRTGFLFSLLAGITMLSEVHTFHYFLNWVYISSAIFSAAVLFTVYKVTQTLAIDSKQLIPIYVFIVLLLVPTIFAPAIAGALLILVLGFYNGHRMGFICGVLAFIYFVSRYYYDLSFTLLTKSLVMMASGALFLILFFLLKKQLHESNEI